MRALTIKLRLYFDHSISTRVAVQNLFLFDITKIEEVILDFSSIQFISSSASHQFSLEIKKLQKQNITITFSNVVDNVEKMLELAKTDRKNIFTVQEIKHQTVTTEEDLLEFLLQA